VVVVVTGAAVVSEVEAEVVETGAAEVVEEEVEEDEADLVLAQGAKSGSLQVRTLFLWDSIAQLASSFSSDYVVCVHLMQVIASSLLYDYSYCSIAIGFCLAPPTNSVICAATESA
jgi:hypothetical protein